MVDFLEIGDQTNTYARYMSSKDAINGGLFQIFKNKSIYLGVDTTRIVGSLGRNSHWVQSQKSYTNGLFLLDLAHMPGSICGTWPLFRLMGSNPIPSENGRIIVMESRLNSENKMIH